MIPTSLKLRHDQIKLLKKWRNSLPPMEDFETCECASDVIFTVYATGIGDAIIAKCQGKKLDLSIGDDNKLVNTYNIRLESDIDTSTFGWDGKNNELDAESPYESWQLDAEAKEKDDELENVLNSVAKATKKSYSISIGERSFDFIRGRDDGYKDGRYHKKRKFYEGDSARYRTFKNLNYSKKYVEGYLFGYKIGRKNWP